MTECRESSSQIRKRKTADADTDDTRNKHKCYSCEKGVENRKSLAGHELGSAPRCGQGKNRKIFRDANGRFRKVVQQQPEMETTNNINNNSNSPSQEVYVDDEYSGVEIEKRLEIGIDFYSGIVPYPSPLNQYVCVLRSNIGVQFGPKLRVRCIWPFGWAIEGEKGRGLACKTKVT